MQITKYRWEELLSALEFSLFEANSDYGHPTQNEIDLILCTLKNNTPFEVVDCLCGEDEDEGN